MPKKSRRRRQKQPPDGAKNRNNDTPPDDPSSGTTDGGGAGLLPATADDFIKMARTSLVSQQTAFMDAMMDGSIGDLMAPPDFDEADIAALPLTDMTWFVDCMSRTDIDESSSCGYVTEIQYKVGLVEKERGSNGQPWGTGAIIGRDVGEECDGLSSVKAFCVEMIESRSPSLDRDLEGMLRSVAKACKHPHEQLGTTTAFSQERPGRPHRVLVRNIGWSRDLKPKLRRLGIPEVGTADEALVSSMAAGFASRPDEDQINAGVFGEMHEGSRNGGRAGLQAAAAAATGGALRRMAERGYVDEERKPLGSWRPEVSAVPPDWFARSPSLEEVQLGYRDRMMWGWRTNMELAVERNDASKIADLAGRYPRDQLKALVEMRLLLTKAAEMGLLRACEALLEPHPRGAGASVDGVMSQGNKRQWRALQIESGDKDDAENQTPLNRAAQHGHTAIVAILLQKGADPDLVNSYQGAGPLHYAVARAHKDCVKHLLKGGPGGRSDMHLQDRNGMSALTLVRTKVKESGQSRYKSILSVLEDADENQAGTDALVGGCCSECGKAGARAKCLCCAVVYCGKACQSAHWKLHKPKHRILMASKKKRDS